MFVLLQIKTFLWFWYWCVIYEVSLWSNKSFESKTNILVSSRCILTSNVSDASLIVIKNNVVTTHRLKQNSFVYIEVSLLLFFGYILFLYWPSQYANIKYRITLKPRVKTVGKMN